jgi:transposase
MESTDSVIRTDDSSLLRQQLVIKELENRFLRRQITAQQQEIKQLEASLKQYENPNTPPSKQGGAAKSHSGDGQNGDEDEESEEDDAGGDLVVHRKTGCLTRHASVRVVLSHRMSESVYPEVC